ncbi:ABC transporter ATP-binding protein [Martelella endophytica]|uniref:Macrolide ABC transporter ATP-binding protein n=1 Tax=Martelella endophytica TaxID=1486262 RepID=A0A0D5LU73_MAREN|nr:ABC transporter ATP-binding protein [Martelella endophytica]AJY46893.1 macrolide ABC transporter ATP-binding protein [Martelella endophytica]
MSPLIEFRNVYKIYGAGEAAIHALNGVDFSIEAGEFVSIMGPSGSGKSTAMNILGWLDRPTDGQFLFQGVDTTDLPSSKLTLLRRHLLAFVFQRYNLLPRSSAIENVELPLIYRGVKRAERRERAEQALVEVGLGDRLHQSANDLSGGQQQRVAIARALITQPTVLLADEPTGSLDTKTSNEIMELITGLNRDIGLTVVIVTHEENVARYASRRMQFLDGSLDRGFRPGRLERQENDHVS